MADPSIPDPAGQDTSGPLDDLCRFIDAAPTPFHAVAVAAQRLAAAGFTELDETEHWDDVAGGRFLRRGGTLVAWQIASSGSALEQGLRLVGAHTDSPNLRVRPRPDSGRGGYRQVGVEVYGGALWNSWLDRDLGLAGRLVLADGSVHLVDLRTPLLRIPQLAIHLDSGVNEAGLALNPHQHLQPVWGLGTPQEGQLLDVIAADAGVPVTAVAGFDLMLVDLSPATTLGLGGPFLSAARIDNLVSCWAGLRALSATPPGAGAAVLALFDHEEIGSVSASGADGTLLGSVLDRVLGALGTSVDDRAVILARSRCVSADGAHAIHPNYVDRHDPHHSPVLNGGPTIKHNANVRYATDATTAAWFRTLCAEVGVPVQDFAIRADLRCGSTIGPLTAAASGIATVDVGVPQLAMHSARELCGAEDPQLLARALTAFLDS